MKHDCILLFSNSHTTGGPSWCPDWSDWRVSAMLLGKWMSERIQRVGVWHPVNVLMSCSPMPWAPAIVLAPARHVAWRSSCT